MSPWVRVPRRRARPMMAPGMMAPRRRRRFPFGWIVVLAAILIIGFIIFRKMGS